MVQFFNIGRYVRLDKWEVHGWEMSRSHSLTRRAQPNDCSLSTAHELQRHPSGHSQAVEDNLSPDAELLPQTIDVGPMVSPTKTQSEAAAINTGYNPPYTRRWVLICFAILWVAIIISLQVIYTVSETRKGLASPRSSLRYLWTYGPTALLVVVTVVWRQVDYAVKHLQPWAELATGPLLAERTLLLDYVTPFQLISLKRAIGLRHTVVASAILVFVLIKILTVVSTGLLLVDIRSSEDIPWRMNALATFKASGDLRFDAVDARAATSLYGVHKYNVSLPKGTTNQYAFQSFEPAEAVPANTHGYRASVDVFVADGWQCDIGNLSYEVLVDDIYNTGGNSSYFKASIKSADCEIYNIHLEALGLGRTIVESNYTTPVYGYSAALWTADCSNLAPDNPRLNRFIIVIGHTIREGDKYSSILNSSSILCVPTYRIQPASVSLFLNGTIDKDTNFSGSARWVENVGGTDIVLAVLRSLARARIPATYENSVTKPWLSGDDDGFLASMLALTPGFEHDILLNATWLIEKSRVVYQEHAAQIARLYLLEDMPAKQRSLDGFIRRDLSRLVVRLLPTRVMQSLGGCMLLLTILMMLLMPYGVVPRSVGSIAAAAVILARSPDLEDILRRTGHSNMKTLRETLAGRRFMSAVTSNAIIRRFCIQVFPSSPHCDSCSSVSSNIQWVTPLVLRRSFMLTMIVVTTVILVTLEIFYRMSLAHDGIANVNSDTYQRYAWLYVPTILLVLLATTFNMVDFELELTEPYHKLTRGYTSAASCMLWDPLQTVSIAATAKAFRRSRFALAASSFSVILAPLLTIIASGLFEADCMPRVEDVSVNVLSWFHSTDGQITFTMTDDDYTVPSLVLQANMSYPQWTWNELAFPSLDIVNSITSSHNSANGGIVMLESPALRVSVQCSRIPKSDYLLEHESDRIIYNLTVTDGCGSFPHGPHDPLIGDIGKPYTGKGYVGRVHIGGNDFSSGCATCYLILGKVYGDTTQEWNMFSCLAGLETVQINVTIDLDQVKFATDPVVDESTRQVTTENFSMDMSPYLASMDLGRSNESFDTFMNVMIYGRDGVPVEELLDGNRLVAQFTHTYRQWMAQWLNIYLRNSTEELAKNLSTAAGELPRTLRGVYHNPQRQRLFLNEVSTRLLQAVLAVLLLCAGVIFFLVDMSEVLPKPVGSIVAVASLLAGSDLVNEKSGLIPEGTEWLDDREIQRRGLWANEQFRMGWWDDVNEQVEDSAANDEVKGDSSDREFRIDVKARRRRCFEGKYLSKSTLRPNLEPSNDSNVV